MIDLDWSPDAVVVLDADRRITAANHAATVLLGWPIDVLVGSDCVDKLMPRWPDGTALFAGGWHRSTVLPSVRRAPEREVVVATRRGDQRMRVTAAYLRGDHGAFEGAVLALRPAARVGEPPHGSEVVATVSHELRAPLTSVKGYTSLLLNRWERLDDNQKRTMLEQVHQDADRVTRLITELLDISRLETGRLVLRRQEVDLTALIETVLGKVAMAVPDIECKVDVALDLPRVYADPDKLEQVLTNLVENAAKYASPTGMLIRGWAENGSVSVSVADRGEGIPAADLHRVFRKFYRRDYGRPTGTGLGLWISRGLVEAHGGRLQAESEPGQGSVFTFTLPLVDIDALFATPPAPASAN